MNSNLCTLVAACALFALGSAQGSQNAVMVGKMLGSKAGVGTLEFSPDGAKLLSGNEDGSVRTWNIADKEEDQTLGRSRTPVQGAVYSPDGKWVVTTRGKGTLQIYNVRTGRELQELDHVSGMPLTVGVSSDGRYIAAAGTGRTLTLWRSGETKPMHQIAAHDRAVTAMSFTPDGEFIATVSDDGGIRVWEVASAYLVFSLKLPMELTDVLFSPDGQNLFVAGDDVKMIDLKTSTVVRSFRGHDGKVNSIGLSPNGAYLATASVDRTARLWSVRTGRVLEVLDEQKGNVSSVAFSPDGKYLATGSKPAMMGGRKGEMKDDENIVVWNINEVYPDKRIARYVEREMYHWQQKGEFEKQTDYEMRLATAPAEAGRLFSKGYQMLADEVKEGAVIGTYDPDSERFPVTLPTLGTLSVRVPIDKAEMFKKQFGDVIFRNFIVAPEIRVPEQSSWALKRVELYLPSAKQSFFYESAE